MNWEARDEFVEKMFRRSGSINSRRYYGFGVDDFREFCEGAGIKDIAVPKPVPKTIKNNRGERPDDIEPLRLGHTTANAVEIEMSPLKNKEQVLKNYKKNKAFHQHIRFVVTSANYAQQLVQILNEDQPTDLKKYWIDIIDYEKLNEVAPSAPVNKEEKKRQRNSGRPRGLSSG